MPAQIGNPSYDFANLISSDNQLYNQEGLEKEGTFQAEDFTVVYEEEPHQYSRYETRRPTVV